MTHDLPQGETDLQLIDGALADLGSIHRRASAGTLPGEDFAGLMGRVRERLKRLRSAHLADGEPAIELTDAGAAALAAFDAARRAGLTLRDGRPLGLMTGRVLLERQGALTLIDGGRR